MKLVDGASIPAYPKPNGVLKLLRVSTLYSKYSQCKKDIYFLFLSNLSNKQRWIDATFSPVIWDQVDHVDIIYMCWGCLIPHV